LMRFGHERLLHHRLRSGLSDALQSQRSAGNRPMTIGSLIDNASS
jgi:hypothetical protein